MRPTFVLAAVLLLPLSPAETTAQPDCIDYRDRLHLSATVDLPSYAWDVDIQNDLAYVAGWGINGLYIIDISDPEGPETLSFTPVLNTHAVAVSGQHAFVASTGGLTILDVGNPSSPAFVASLQMPSASYEVIVVNDTLLALSGEDTSHGPTNFQLVSVSNPEIPALLSGIEFSGRPWGLASSGNRVYVITEVSGLSIVDVEDPRQPVVLSRLALPGRNDKVHVQGGFAYVSDGSGNILVVDVNDPASPFLQATVACPGSPWGLFTDADRLYVGNGIGIAIFDLTDPANPTFLARYDLMGETFGVAVRDRYAYLASYGGLQIVDVSALGTVDQIAVVSTTNANDIHVSGDLAYVADGAGGLTILDVSVPQSPESLSSLTTEGEVFDVRGEGNLAVLLDRVRAARLLTVDMSDPEHPVRRGTLELSAGPYYYGSGLSSLEVSGNMAYVAAGTSGLTIVDLTDPDSPRVVGRFETQYDAVSVAIQGDLLLLGTYTPFVPNDYRRPSGAALLVLWLEAPERPVYRGRLDIRAFSMQIVGERAYIGGDGFSVVDISRPDFPEIIATDVHVTALSPPIVNGDIVYTVDDRGVHVLDISELPVIRRYGEAVAARAYAMAEKDGVLLVADGRQGIRVFPGQCGADSRITPTLNLPPPYPNPTRGPVSIGFSVDEAGPVHCDIFDVGGRQVRPLRRDVFSGGRYAIEWDGTDGAGRPVPSGVYYILVSTQSTSGIARLTVIR